ncbi:ATP-binding protein [Kineosporia sp. R_H_3]|uniref:sensor histidine kinase n=1 Tax=Kineosporia sp. R_H_3 TaxID=1961848 RepID=UPI000B4AAD9B|nr:ATP-binding protein [Kineosporia sp. R_H_3]
MTCTTGPAWPPRRPLTASERRLLQMIDKGSVDDLVAQALLLAIVVWVGSPWLWVGWASRWLALAGARLARREILADRTHRALFLLAVGHGLAGIGAVVSVPEAAPLVMLVMFGDLTLAGYTDRGARRGYFALCLANAALVALVSLGDWSDVADLAPRWLYVVVLGAHGLATGTVAARIARETYTVLRDRGDRLRALAARARDADREGQLEVARALSSSTARDLARLADVVAGLRTERDAEQVRSGAAEGSATAKNALARLRALSHGVFPDVLHQHGLGAALRALDHTERADPAAPGVVVAQDAQTRLPPDVESAFYALVAACRRARPGAGLTAAIRQRRGYAELLLTGDGPGTGSDGDGLEVDDDTLAALTDRVDGVRGTLEVTRTDGRTTVHAAAPLDVAPSGTDADPQAVAILTRFISSSTLLCALGLVATSAVWAVTRLLAVGIIDAVLVVVMASVLGAGALERRGRRGAALGLLCFETAFAGIVVSAAIPAFAPTAALIVMLPLILGLPYLSRRALEAIGVAQTLIVVGVICLGVAETGLVDAALLPQWVYLSLLAPTVVAVGLLVVVALGEGRAAVDASNEHLQTALLDLLKDIDATRRGIERDLHDGAQQHLAALAIQLHVAEQLAAQAAAAGTDGPRRGPGPLAQQPVPTPATGVSTPWQRLGVVLDRVAGQVEQAREELALLVDGRFGETLREIGVDEALRRSAALARRPVTVSAQGADDVPAAAAMTAYFVCNEAVQNATKHAGPEASVAIDLRLVEDADGPRLTFRVSDDGQGCDPAVLHAGRGVAELVRRVREAGGDLVATSAPGRGTALTGWVPAGPQVAAGTMVG